MRLAALACRAFDNAPAATLSHVDARGPRPDGRRVGARRSRRARRSPAAASACRPRRCRQMRAGNVKKGDPLQTARLAGIMAAKQTSALIPLCHPLPLSHVDVELTPTARRLRHRERASRTTAQTGVEMEALTAVAVAALTIYDMVKAVDKAMVIGDIRLAEKRGGKSGEYIARARR